MTTPAPTVNATEDKRPEITLENDKILRNGVPVRVAFTRDSIKVGCSDIQPEAASFLLRKYNEYFPRHKEVVHQP